MRKTLTVLGGVALVLAVTGTATGTIDRLIRGSDVKNGSLTGRDVRNGSIGGGDLRNRSVANRDIAPRTITSYRIKKSAVRLLARERLTPENAAFGDIRVVDVPAAAANSGDPDERTEGVELYPAARLTAGRYLVQGSTIFFDFTGLNDPAAVEYGVTQVFRDGAPLLVGTGWSSDIPDDGNNGAMASGSFVLTVPPGGSTLEVRAVIRSTEDTAGVTAGQAGGNLIVTKLAAP